MEYGKIWFGEDVENEELEERSEKLEKNVEFRRYKTSDGDVVKVMITDAYVRIKYSNGAVEVINIENLRVCPKCLAEGLLPFTSSHICPIHEEPTIPYDPEDFYAFEIALSK